MGMLVLSRKVNEEIVIQVTEPMEIRIAPVQIYRNRVKLGCTARRSALILRGELLDAANADTDAQQPLGADPPAGIGAGAGVLRNQPEDVSHPAAAG